jgi:hypothetical protein
VPDGTRGQAASLGESLAIQEVWPRCPTR